MFYSKLQTLFEINFKVISWWRHQFILKRFFTFQTLQALETRNECFIWHFRGPVQLKGFTLVISLTYNIWWLLAAINCSFRHFSWCLTACVIDIEFNLRTYAFFLSHFGGFRHYWLEQNVHTLPKTKKSKNSE